MKNIKIITVFLLLFFLEVYNSPLVKAQVKTFCNPLNISYRFRPEEPSRREAADPTIVVFKDKYYLFASKSGGYWVSDDLIKWKFITNNDLPWESYAPTAVTIGDELYFMASGDVIYKTKDPEKRQWQKCGQIPISVVDPCLFLDDNGRLYLYYGCSPKEPTKVVELDMENECRFIGTPVSNFKGNPEEHGFEQKGDYNDKQGMPWIEGSWMNKYKGKYYLQYAGPGTEFKSYADGVYVSDNPLGPFTYASYSPFSYKPEGFVAGAGHSSTFSDKYGNYWHIATMVISKKHQFERRLGLFPTGFDKDGELHTFTGFGDYPTIIPNKRINDPASLFTGWMLLSYNKSVEVSSTLKSDSTKAIYAVDEDIKTYWSAATGNKGEWICVDLKGSPEIKAIQINFAEQDSKLFGRDNKIIGAQYIVEYSNDKKTWSTITDKSSNTEDLSHVYFQLKKSVKARYIRLTNVHVPDGKFAVSGVRVFGSNNKVIPNEVKDFKIERDISDPRIVKLSWEKQLGATGYNVRFGIAKNKLFKDYIVYSNNRLTIRSLNKYVSYWFTIDAFNESGIRNSSVIKEVK